MTETLWWCLVALMIVAGLVGTLLPALPGTALILGGIFLGAWIDGFSRVGTYTLVACSVLALLSWVLEYAAGLLGAKKVGASKWALVGAAVGTVVGLAMGLVGVLFMPLVGAAAGEYWAQRQQLRAGVGADVNEPSASMGAGAAASAKVNGQQQLQRALHVGVAAWLGLMAGLLAKVVLGFVMVGVFAAALLLNRT
jgi:uncharacterized protein